MLNHDNHPLELFEPVHEGGYHVPPLPAIQAGPYLGIQAVFATINSARPPVLEEQAAQAG